MALMTRFGPRALFRLRIVIRGMPAATTAVTPRGLALTAMGAMAAVAEKMHCDHSSDEEQPDPVLRKPFHLRFLFRTARDDGGLESTLRFPPVARLTQVNYGETSDYRAITFP